MIALKMFPIAEVLLILFTGSSLGYHNSFYNAKQPSRSTHRPTYDPYEYYPRSQRYPYGYYPTYSQMYPEEYYYSDDSYPMYYVDPRTANYDLYQTGLPYYYQDVPVAPKKYNYNKNYGKPSAAEQERLLQEMEREQRERSQPIGHEIRYENDYNNDDDDGNGALVDETNAAFLNNLMMQQMYQDSVKDKAPLVYPPAYYEQYPYQDYSTDEADAINIPRWDDAPYDRPVNVEDEDVKELKELPKKQKQRKNRQRKQRKQKIENFDNENPVKRSQDNVVYTDRKPVVKDVFPTVVTELPTDGPRRDVRGQKEEVMMRPATPVRHPFSDSVLNMLNQQPQEKKRSPSVYDTIRHMLEMERKYEEENQQPEPKTEMKPSMKKRIVSSEDSLIRQLSVLKKAQ